MYQPWQHFKCNVLEKMTMQLTKTYIIFPWFYDFYATVKVLLFQQKLLILFFLYICVTKKVLYYL